MNVGKFGAIMLLKNRGARRTMDEKIYTLTRIEGEYAYLKDEEGCEIFIALLLLPMGSDVGTRLKCENFSFELI